MDDFLGLRYLPVLEVRPAELLALQELPNKDKDALCPLFRLRPWVSSNKLQSSIDKLISSFGDRRCFLEVADEEVVEAGKRRAVHDELDELRRPENGYLNWYEFLSDKSKKNFIPSVQALSYEQFAPQVDLLYSLGRGLLLRIESPHEAVASAAAKVLGSKTAGGVGVFVLLDYAKQGSSFLQREAEIKRVLHAVLEYCPNACVSFSASSFPNGFVSLSKQDIFERLLFEKLKGSIGSKFVYSDRGSARAEKQLGGGGLPAPRIDFAGEREWVFFRQDGAMPSSFLGYQSQARLLMKSSLWDKKLKLWACQMIERTANGDSKGGISSPNRSTAVRINMHLHRQLHFGNQSGFYDTDEEWVG